MGGQGVDLRPSDRYVLPETLRGELAKPFGPILQTEDLPTALEGHDVVAVGDIVAKTLIELDLHPRYIVCDYKTQRGDDDPALVALLGAWGDHEICVDNPAATVTREAWDAIIEATGRRGTRIIVNGEEDLLGLPAMWEADDGTRVLYGAPGLGVVVVTVDAALKARIQDLVARLD